MWKESYLIQVPVIDKQHKKLFEMVEELSAIVNSDRLEEEKKDMCKEAIIFMKAYVIMHFKDEEAYQRQVNHPRYEQHCQIHSAFRAEIGDYETMLEESRYDLERVKDFNKRLMDWLVEHVTGEDQLLKKDNAI